MANGDPIRIGQSNFGGSGTILQATINTPSLTIRAQVGGGSSGDAVTGQADSAVGVVGVNLTGESNAGPAGVHGVGPRSIGVHGESSRAYGAARSTSGVGVAAVTAGALPALLVYATGGGAAGRFEGDVLVNGSLTVSGIKPAAVRHPDGTIRRLHCVEAPEAMFEDMGEVELTEGRAQVKLDPDFAALVDVDDYQVQLTSYAPAALYVSRREAEAFEIAVVAGERTPRTPEPMRCGWRVVARRKDVERERLAVVSETERPDVLADMDLGTSREVPRVGEPASARLDPPAVPAERPLPAPPEAPRADLADLQRHGEND